MGESAKHVGFRNNKLFCWHCGTSYDLQLPSPVDMAVGVMEVFAKSHEKCEKTWVEPSNDAKGKSMKENADWWAANGSHGISSLSMFNHLIQGTDIRPLANRMGPSNAWDPDDFSRCYKLLEAVPQFKQNLQMMKTLSPRWALLVDNWDKLTEMYEENVRTNWKKSKEIGMSEFMHALLK